MPADPPHSYKEQRLMERRARESREAMLARGDTTIPTMCGFTYKPRPTKTQKADKNWKPKEIACQRIAGAGTDHHGRGYCDYHEWAVVNEVDRQLTPRNDVTLAMKTATERAKFFGRPKAIDPHATLLEEIGRSASIVQYVEDIMQQMRDEYGWSDAQIMTQDTFKDGVKASVWMELYAQERDHLVKTCIAAIKAGVAERKVQIAEQQARLLAGVMFAFMHDPELALSPDQMLQAPKLIRKHMLALPTADPATLDPERMLARHQAIEVNAQ